MTRSPRITGRKAIVALAAAGFQVVRVKGSHPFLRHPDGQCTVVPVHPREVLGPGLLAKILHDVELTAEQFRKLV
jgi:predicted RNA binding protein YcfA (HicA-like mRNA interferase family)